MMRIRELRTQKGISQKDLAALLNVPPNTFNQWEKEKRQPDINMLIRLADFFNVSVDYLIGRTDSAYEIPVAARSGKIGKATSPHTKDERRAALESEFPGVFEDTE